MNFSPEQLDILRKGFQLHDIAQGVPLSGYDDIPAEQAKSYQALRKQVRDTLLGILPDFNMDRNMRNFSDNYPVNLLIDADAQVVAGQAAQILSDEQQTLDAVDRFLELFEPLLETASESYCAAKGKTEDDLTDEDIERITQRVVKVVNEELMTAVMLGQQVPEILGVVRDSPAHEDYPVGANDDSINFYKKWNHSDTKVGTMLSLDAMEDSVPGKSAEDKEKDYRLFRESFLKTLDETNRRIFALKEQGRTQEQIAKALGFRTHSAVSKRLKTIQQRFRQFQKENG